MKTSNVILYAIFILLHNNPAEGSIFNYFEPSMENGTSVVIASVGDIPVAEKPESATGFVNSVHTKVKNLCRQLHNKSTHQEIVEDRRTKIHVECVLPINQTGNKNISWWSIEYAKLEENDEKPLEIKFPSESWKPCDVETSKNGSNGGISCYAVVEYVFPDSVDADGADFEPIVEAFLVTDKVGGNMSASHQVKHPKPGDELRGNSSAIFDLLEVLGNSSTRCARWNATLGNGTGESRICELASTPITTNFDIVTCTCSVIGFYRVLYMDEPIKDPGFEWNGTENGVAFWLDFKYKEKVPRRKTEFEASLLSQLLTQLGYKNSSLEQAVKLELVPPMNSNTTTIELTFWDIGNVTRLSQEDEKEFLSRLDQALFTASLNLTDYRRNRTNLAIPIQRLRIMAEATEDKVIGGTPVRKDSIFLWFIFGTVVLLAVTLIIVGIRNRQRESADSVQPIPFRSVEELGMSGGEGLRNTSNGGHTESCLASARSMTTIISESSDGGGQEEARKIGSSSVGIGVHNFGSKESPSREERRPPSAFRVVPANDIVVTDTGEVRLDRIHSMAPLPGDEDDEDTKSSDT